MVRNEYVISFRYLDEQMIPYIALKGWNDTMELAIFTYLTAE